MCSFYFFESSYQREGVSFPPLCRRGTGRQVKRRGPRGNLDPAIFYIPFAFAICKSFRLFANVYKCNLLIFCICILQIQRPALFANVWKCKDHDLAKLTAFVLCIRNVGSCRSFRLCLPLCFFNSDGFLSFDELYWKMKIKSPTLRRFNKNTSLLLKIHVTNIYNWR